MYAGRAVLVIVDIGKVFNDLFQFGRVADDDIQLFGELVTSQLAQKCGMTEDQAERGPKLVGGDGDKVRFEPLKFRQLDLRSAGLSPSIPNFPWLLRPPPPASPPP